MARREKWLLHRRPVKPRTKTTPTQGQMVALDRLNFSNERDMLVASLREGCEEVGRQIELRVRPATTDALRSVVTLGSRAIHYAGHGHPDFLSFEDGRGGVHAVDVGVLGSLFAAGGTNETQLVFVSACFSRRAGEAGRGVAQGQPVGERGGVG